MHRDITHLLYRRVGPSTTLIVILLALAGFAGRSRLVSTLRGFAVDNEASQAPVGGYYEALIGAPEFVSAGKTVGPPPRWLAFGAEEAGIVREVSTYLRWEMRPNLDLRWNGTGFEPIAWVFGPRRSHSRNRRVPTGSWYSVHRTPWDMA